MVSNQGMRRAFGMALFFHGLFLLIVYISGQMLLHYSPARTQPSKVIVQLVENEPDGSDVKKEASEGPREKGPPNGKGPGPRPSTPKNPLPTQAFPPSPTVPSLDKETSSPPLMPDSFLAVASLGSAPEENASEVVSGKATDHVAALGEQEQGNNDEENQPPAAMGRKKGADPGLLRNANPLSNPPPPYPDLARKRGLEGTVVIDVLVAPEGRVGGVRLFSSSGHPILDRAATIAVYDWSFTPAMRGDKAIEMWVRIPLRYALQ